MKKLNKPEFSIKDIIEENNNYFEKELNEEINLEKFQDKIKMELEK